MSSQLTARLGLHYPSASDPDNVPEDIHQLANDLEGLVSLVVASSSRPSSPHQGDRIWESDTGISRVWTGGGWQHSGGPPRIVTPGTTPTGGLSGTPLSTSLTSLSSSTAFPSVTVTARGPNAHGWATIPVGVASSTTGWSRANFRIAIDGTILSPGGLALYDPANGSGTVSVAATLTVPFTITAAGSHLFEVFAAKASSGGTVYPRNTASNPDSTANLVAAGLTITIFD